MGWDAVAAIAQVAAAIFALLGLGFVGYQIRLAGKTADFGHLRDLVQDVTVGEQAMLRAATDAEREAAFYAFLNLLETYAAAVNAGLLRPASKKIAREKLIDSLAAITSQPQWYPILREAMTSSSVLSELVKFSRREEKAIKETADRLGAADQEPAS